MNQSIPFRSARVHAWALVAALSLVSGCGGASRPSLTPAEARIASPEALLDPASYAVAQLDLARLRRSPHAPALEALLEEMRGAGGGAPGLESVLGATDRVVVGLAENANDDAVATVVLVGTVAPALLADAMTSELGPDVFRVVAEPAPWRAIGPTWTVLHDGHGLAVLTPTEATDALLARWEAPGATPLDASPTLTEGAALSSWRTGALGVIVDPGRLPRRMKAELEGAPAWETWGTQLVAAGARLDLADGLDLGVVGRLTSVELADSLAAAIRDELARAQRNLLLDLLLGVRPILAATFVTSEADVTRVTTRLPAGDTERFIASLRSVVGYADRALEELREEGREAPPETGEPLQSPPPAGSVDGPDPSEPAGSGKP